MPLAWAWAGAVVAEGVSGAAAPQATAKNRVVIRIANNSNLGLAVVRAVVNMLSPSQ